MAAPPLSIPNMGSPSVSLWLVRWNVGTGVGTVVLQIGEEGFHAEALPAGTYRYEVWAVQGPNPAGSGINYISRYLGIAKLAVIHAKR